MKSSDVVLNQILIHEGNLREKSIAVENIDEDILNKLDIILDIMYKNDCIGLAGNHLGFTEKLVAMDLQNNGIKKPMFMINPEIIEQSEEMSEYEEGCLAVPFFKVAVKRPAKIKVKYLDKQKQEQILLADGILATCIQHQTDLLNGILIVDYLAEDEKNELFAKIEKELKKESDTTKQKKTFKKEEKIALNKILLHEGNLREKMISVKNIDKNILEKLDIMLEKMYTSRGIGIAANQVGFVERLVTIDLQIDDVKSPMFLINPEIIESSEEMSEYEEGCLSIPFHQKAVVKRPSTVKAKYTDREGNEQIIFAEGLMATCLQHEIDHLNGILFIDHLSKLKKDMLIKKIKKEIQKEKYENNN